jgi:hypothetical protein
VGWAVERCRRHLLLCQSTTDAIMVAIDLFYLGPKYILSILLTVVTGNSSI